MTKIMVALLVALQACAVDDVDTGERRQAEIIEVHGGCPPGTIGNGQICVDPLEGGNGPGGGGGPTGGEGGPGGPGGSGPTGGGGGGGRPPPIPDRKDCSGLGIDECKDCCLFNWDKVDYERCTRLRTRVERAVCYASAAQIYGSCIGACPRDPGPLTTVSP